MDLSKIEKLYSDNLEKFGINSKSVGWSTPSSQKLRFEKLLQVVEKKNEPFTINELGCGYGELFRYCEKNGYELRYFNGYDISENMLDAARKYVNNNEKASFYKESKIKTQTDYTITCGIFNVIFDEDKTKWEDYIKNTLKDMFANSTKGISFNLLTKYVDFEAKDLYYADPAYYFDFCKRELSRFVTLIHDYNLYEWTILVKKQ